MIVNQKPVTKNKWTTVHGDMADVLFVTSDGREYFDSPAAVTHADTLKDTRITVLYRDEEIRKLGSKNKQLRRIIQTTDILKALKVMNKPSIDYDQYLKFCKGKNYEFVSESIFTFLQCKVYRNKKPMVAGETDTILSLRHGIVEAVFLRRYDQGQVWHYKDELIFTCPTNTELIGGSYRQIFNPLLNPLE